MSKFKTISDWKYPEGPSKFNVTARDPTNIWQGSFVTKNYIEPHDGFFYQ